MFTKDYSLQNNLLKVHEYPYFYVGVEYFCSEDYFLDAAKYVLKIFKTKLEFGIILKNNYSELRMTNTNNSKNEIKVSVILPVYNVGKYLRECLDAIVNQSLKEIEIICVNDSSTDNSLEILNEYAQKDGRFIVITQENKGPGIARNNAVEIAQGKYIQFVDPDDWIEIGMLETLYNFAQEHNSQVVKFNYKEYNDYSRKYKNVNFADKIKKDYNYNLLKTPSYTWQTFKQGCLYKLNHYLWSHFYLKDFIKSNNIQCAPTKNGEDQLFANGAILLANKVDYLDKYLYFYRIRSGSLVRIKSEENFGVFDNIECLKLFLINNNLYNDLKEEWLKYAREVISWHYKKVPDKSIDRFEELCLQYFDSKKEFIKFRKKIITNKSFIEQIFSIKNDYKDAIKYKIITILGFKIKLKI